MHDIGLAALGSGLAAWLSTFLTAVPPASCQLYPLWGPFLGGNYFRKTLRRYICMTLFLLCLDMMPDEELRWWISRQYSCLSNEFQVLSNSHISLSLFLSLYLPSCTVCNHSRSESVVMSICTLPLNADPIILPFPM